MVESAREKALARSRGLDVLQSALAHWEVYLQEQLAFVDRPEGQMEELIRQDREALNELLRGLL